MERKSVKKSKTIKNYINVFKVIYMVASFGIIDVWLRITTRWMGYYSIFEIPPNLFTLSWSVLLTCLLYCIPKVRVRKVVYGICYYIFLIYAVVQYGSYLILGRILYISDFMLAKEGTDYSSFIASFLNLSMVIQIVLLICTGMIGVVIIPNLENGKWKNKIYYILGILTAIIVVGTTPNLYGKRNAEWDDFVNPAFEYKQFTNSCFDLELTGMYQFIARDLLLKFEKMNQDYTSVYEEIDQYFEKRPNHQENTYTGKYKGKNVIFVMMESMDDWLISSEDTPTISYMMEHGVNFTNFYTPDYSTGYTFNTEFASNTGIYPYSNGNVAYSLSKNRYSNSIANTFYSAGYSVNSFHCGSAAFYNRGAMHEAWGYEKYHSYTDYESEDVSIHNDIFLTESNELYSDLIADSPFFSFVITYSPHLPYTEEDEVFQEAVKQYPEYAEGEVNEEDVIRAKAKLTDDMFEALLKQLEQDGILEDTVIVAFADHYAFGLNNKEFLQEVSEEAGNSILENTPAFIYCAANETSVQVDKVMQTVDLVPTVANLCGIEVSHEIMGSDIFDENYPGYAIFPNNTWITEQAYMKDGTMIWNNGMREDDISRMKEYVQETYQVNDGILDSDYYRYLSEK